MSELARAQKSIKRGRLAHAFTLTEMLVVLVIIGLIAAIVGPRLFTRLNDAKRRTAHLQITNLMTAIDLFRIDVGRPPTQSEGLDALIAAPSDAPEWVGPYLARARVPLDPWGHAYAYKLTSSSGVFGVVSYGADGREGGNGAAADIEIDSNPDIAPPTSPPASAESAAIGATEAPPLTITTSTP